MELLGTGGTGQTWLCQHHETARRVAVKFVPRPLPPVLVPLISMELQVRRRSVGVRTDGQTHTKLQGGNGAMCTLEWRKGEGSVGVTADWWCWGMGWRAAW